jgi:hypothetical protein
MSCISSILYIHCNFCVVSFHIHCSGKHTKFIEVKRIIPEFYDKGNNTMKPANEGSRIIINYSMRASYLLANQVSR